MTSRCFPVCGLIGCVVSGARRRIPVPGCVVASPIRESNTGHRGHKPGRAPESVLNRVDVERDRRSVALIGEYGTREAPGDCGPYGKQGACRFSGISAGSGWKATTCPGFTSGRPFIVSVHWSPGLGSVPAVAPAAAAMAPSARASRALLAAEEAPATAPAKPPPPPPAPAPPLRGASGCDGATGAARGGTD